ncbi:MAG: glycosyltransferase [Aeromicrobium sp.]
MTFLQRPVPLTTRPLVTVVVPCYNYGHFLEECVASVLTQSQVSVEVLIVDDASPDGSGEVARAIADRHAEVDVVVHETNMGHIATYNDGLARATGTYVLILSADDLLTPGALHRACAVLETRPTVGLVYGFAPSFRTTPPAASARRVRWCVWSGRTWLAVFTRRCINPVSTPSAVVRRTALAAVGGYDPRLPHAADLLLWLRLGAAWDVAYIAGASQAYYRKHATNMHVVEFGGVLADLGERKRTFDIFFSEGGDALPSADRLRRRTMRALHREACSALVSAQRAGERATTVEGLADLCRRLAEAAGLESPGANHRRRRRAIETSLVTRTNRLVLRRIGVYL